MLGRLRLGIDERAVLLETKHVRVVGIGRNGWRIRLVTEQAHKDTMGGVSWHPLDQRDFKSDGTSENDQIIGDALLAALDENVRLAQEIEQQKRTIDRLEGEVADLTAEIEEVG